MLNKFLEKKVEVISDGISQTEENNIKLEYYLLESDYVEGEEVQKSYGVEIIKRNESMPEESRQFKNIFCCRDKARNLVDMLAKNTVTPIALPYILDDMIGI